MYTQENVNKVFSELEMLRHLRNSVKERQHAIDIEKDVYTYVDKEDKKEQQWDPFEPTRFIYTFCLFNNLYNIKWDVSLQTGLIYCYDLDSNKTEKGKIDEYKDFCFQDKEFVDIYKEVIVDCLHNFCSQYEDFKKLLDSVVPDDEKTFKIGNIKRNEVVGAFNNVYANDFGKAQISLLLKYLYIVRCNIFHGKKGIEQLKEESQRKRLLLYSDFLMAIINMSFDYVEYLKNK